MSGLTFTQLQRAKLVLLKYAQNQFDAERINLQDNGVINTKSPLLNPYCMLVAVYEIQHLIYPHKIQLFCRSVVELLNLF